MKVTPAQVSAILRTLPIGYYLGTRAPVVLDEAADTSSVNLMTREIHVAFRNVVVALAPLPETADTAETETAIRNELYHETAHLLLTPRDGLYPFDYVNILEDERIETLTRNLFHGVKFRDSIRQLNGYGPNWRPENARSFLFGVARFRHGPRELIEKLDAMISRFSNVNCNAGRYGKDGVLALAEAYADFAREVDNYWNAHEAEIKNPPAPPSPPSPTPSAEDGQKQSAPPSPPPAEDKEDGKDAPGDGATAPRNWLCAMLVEAGYAG